jgi:eukaryotic-like serine/threonine-protein kinase
MIIGNKNNLLIFIVIFSILVLSIPVFGDGNNYSPLIKPVHDVNEKRLNLVILWSSPIGAIDSSPKVVNGVVYVASIDQKVDAFDAATGAKLWEYSLGGPTGIECPTLTVANGVVYIGNLDNKIYALDAKTGSKLWDFETGGIIFLSNPVVANGSVYIGDADHKLYALNATTGMKIWDFSTGNAILSTPAMQTGLFM